MLRETLARLNTTPKCSNGCIGGERTFPVTWKFRPHKIMMATCMRIQKKKEKKRNN